MRDRDQSTATQITTPLIVAILIAMIASLFVAGSARAQQAPSKDQQKCIRSFTKGVAAVAKTQGKENQACLKNAIKGSTKSLGVPPQDQTAQACLTNDVKGKVAKASAKLSAGDADGCIPDPPSIGYTGAATGDAAARAQTLALVEDLFGPDLDAATLNFSYPDDAAPACQQAVLKGSHATFDTMWKIVRKAKSDALKGKTGSPAKTDADLQVAIFGAIQADTKGKIAKAVSKLTDAATAACAPTAATMASLFPGACSGAIDGAQVAACADPVVKCRVCVSVSEADGFANGCDIVDDGVANASCPGSAGPAAAREITDAGDLITGPLAHSKIGDYLLENDVARFIIQDVAQRDMWSVGAFGGNIIDAELVANPGIDNFLEIQPMVNVETVINAQTVEIVNDGSNGAPAIVRTCGPDDILDFVNPSTVLEDAGVNIPSLADDKDAPVEGCTDYILSPGDSHLEVVTTIFNSGGQTQPLYVGDWINASGEVELWASSSNAGIGEQLVNAPIGVLSYIGFGEALGVDYSHVVLPDPTSEFPIASFFSTSGVAVVMHSHSVIAAVLGELPTFSVAPGGNKAFTRLFGVGDGSGANAIALENELKSIAAGEVSGCVTVGGVAEPFARITLGPDSGGITNVTANWTADASGCYSGEVPEGTYGIAAWQEGVPFEGGGGSPVIHTVVIAEGAPVVQDFALPDTGTLSVTVVDELGSPVPARVSVVGFDPSPEFVFVSGVLGPETTGLFRDQNDRIPFGMTRAVYADAAGTANFRVEPGSYHVYVSRGTEWSLFDTPVTITAGATTNVAAEIAHVLDTTGFVSSDYHVHGLRSADSRVSNKDRVMQFAGEGVDNIIMTDHHAHTDLTPTISALSYTPFVHSTVGEEITTWDTGHYNAYPMLVLPSLPSGGSTDWGQAAPPGEDFKSLGAYIATPAEVDALATTGAASTPDTVIQINHIDSHFVPMKIDTSLVPPASALTPTEKLRFRLPPQSGDLFHHFNILENWNGSSRGAQSNFIDERIGIWFNLLNQGLITTSIADTDTHRFQNLSAAGARTWTASSTDSPAAMSDSELASAVDSGRAVGGQGVYVQTRLVAVEDPGIVADLELGGSTLISITDPVQGVTLEIDVQAPIWAEFDTIDIYANATTIPSPTSSADELFSATPTATLTAGVDFAITTTNVFPLVAGAERLDASVSVPFVNLPEDTWFVVVVRGSDGISKPMFPVYADSLSSGSNSTLPDLIDGNLGESGTLAMGFTNALYVDADGTPGFQAPLAP